jgi:hypothetical protein
MDGDHRSPSSGPPLGALSGSESDAELDVTARYTDSAMFFAMNELGPLLNGRRLCRLCPASAVVSRSEGGIWAVSDPLCHPHVEVRALEEGGALTPQMRVTIVRPNRALSCDCVECAAVSPAACVESHDA